MFDLSVVVPAYNEEHRLPDTLAKLPDEISYSDAGVTVRETRDLWNLPIVFIMLLSLRAAEWLMRRKWGVV